MLKVAEESAAAAMDIGPNPTIESLSIPDAGQVERKPATKPAPPGEEAEQDDRTMYIRIRMEYELYYEMKRLARSRGMIFHRMINDALRGHMERLKS